MIAVLQNITRKGIRQSVGDAQGWMDLSAATSDGTTTTLIDINIDGDDNEMNGGWLVFHDGVNAGEIRRAADYDASTFTISWNTAVETAVVTDHTYEFWKNEYRPDRINRLINDAIKEVTGLYFVPVVDASLHGDSRQTRFSVPAALDMIHTIEYRTSMNALLLHSMGAVWDELVDGDATAVLDSKDYKRQSYSLKLTTAGTISAGDIIATDSLSSKNLTGFTHIELWVKVRTAVAAGDLALLLDDTPACVSPLETLTLPALSAGEWTRVRLPLASPSLLSSIISIGLEYNANPAANTIWLDDIVAMDDASEEWSRMNPILWSINRDSQEIVLHPGGRRLAGYTRLRLLGGTKPTLVDADDDVLDVPADYVVNWVTGRMMLSEGGGAATDPDAHHPRSAPWFGAADAARRAMHLPMNARFVR